MIIYSLIAKKSLVIAEYTSHDGDFPEMARKILSKTKNTNNKKCFIKGNYTFTFCSEEEFTFCCLTENSTSKEIAFKFLDNLAETFFDENTKNNIRTSQSSTAFLTILIKNLIVKI